MERRKYGFLSSILLLLLAGCGATASLKEVTQEQLDASLSVISGRNVSSGDSYQVYKAQVSEKYGNTYLSKESTFASNPIGFDIPDEHINSDSDRPAYAKDLIQNGSVEYKFNDFGSSNFGRYRLELEYYAPETFASTPLIELRINGVLPFSEASLIVLPLLYEDNIEKDADGNKLFDNYVNKYGDQMSPNQKRLLKWQTNGLYESTFQTTEPLIFDISSANPTITINNLSNEYFYIGKLTLVPVTKDLPYQQYYSTHASAQGTDDIEVNAIEYTYKNGNDISLSNEQTPAVIPYLDKRKLINVTSGWDKTGEAISFEIEVNSAGYYPITLHYYNGNDNFPLYRKIEVNGEVPFKEVENYKFPTTGSKYANKTIEDEDGNPYMFYLNQGKNTITLSATIEPLYDIYTNLMAVYDDINDFAIDIRKITGSSTDTYRTYKITQYFQDTNKVLRSYKYIIYDSYYKLKEIVGNKKASSVLTYFTRMFELIDEFLKDPDDLPLNLTKFSSGDSCLAKLIADTATSIQGTNMVLDTMYITNNKDSIRPSNASWFKNVGASFISLGQTFTSDKYKTVLNEGELNIWSARSQAYNDILQTFADNYFTPNTKTSEFPNGIKVNIRQMPSEDNLIYAYAANTVPDLALGINSGRAFEFALRGEAAYPLSDFDTSWKYTNNHWGFSPYYWDVAANVPHGQLLSMLYNDKFYSLPETTSIQLMFSRDDIMNVIGENGQPLEIPETWEELKGMLYRIQSYGMNFYYTTSASGSLKPLATTAQFILQNNGKILKDYAYESDLRSNETYEALKLLTDLYTIYALPTEVASFYNHFRYGTYPLGISDLGMYLSLKYVAPELLGKWSVHHVPGIRQNKNSEGEYDDINNDGVGDEISRWYISNGSSAMIFNNSKLIDEAWLFLQWWMQTDIQEMFTEALQASFGPSVLWVSANMDAIKSLPIDTNVREVALEQVKWIVDLQQIPGQYMLERGLSDIWNMVVFGKQSSGNATTKNTIGEAIDLQKILIDREIQRKLEEFGYFDTNKTTPTRDYIMRSYNWVQSCFDNYKNGTKGGNAQNGVCPI